MSDTRPYIFALMNSKQWIFIAVNDLPPGFIAIEKWQIDQKSYLFYRVSYTQPQAAQLIQKQMSGQMTPMEGPDLYQLYEIGNEERPVATVWKPSLPGLIEIQLGHQTVKLNDNVGFEVIKSTILKLMGDPTVTHNTKLCNDSLLDYKIQI